VCVCVCVCLCLRTCEVRVCVCACVRVCEVCVCVCVFVEGGGCRDAAATRLLRPLQLSKRVDGSAENRSWPRTPLHTGNHAVACTKMHTHGAKLRRAH
jgi:hypothetical protein